MTRNQIILTDYKFVPNGKVTFSDGVQGKVIGKRTLNMEGFPMLEGDLHVDGLQANLISISQICDLDLHVNFTLEKCSIVDNFGNYFLEGIRSVDHCYTLSQPLTCHNVSGNNTNIMFPVIILIYDMKD